MRRWAATWAATALGVETLTFTVSVWPDPSAADVVATGCVAALNVWLIGFLRQPHTAELFRRRSAEAGFGRGGVALLLLDLLNLCVILLGGWALLRAGFGPGITLITGLSLAVLYGWAVQQWLLRRWLKLFASSPQGVGRADVPRWRKAWAVLERGDTHTARTLLAGMAPESRCSPDVALLEALVNWSDLLAGERSGGATLLRRAALDALFRPSDEQTVELTQSIKSLPDTELRDLLEAREQLLSSLVSAAMEPASVFHAQAPGVLARITGLAFGPASHETWGSWWQAHRALYSGDAGGLALVARLIRTAPAAAAALAERTAGRAEEPLLRELAGQIVYLTALQRAIQSRSGVDTHIRQATRLLLVPELADALGILHADSSALESQGLPPRAVARRLLMRGKLIAYAYSLWQRYPGELDEDMPWLIKTLTAHNFGNRRARERFEEWWPAGRESLKRHDRALGEGLVAFAEQRFADAEEAFRAALKEQRRELTARYNLALCLKQRNEFEAAKELLQELTLLEPKEPYWWIALGTLHRTVKQSADAHAAFNKALQLGAAASRVSFQIGLTFAHERQDAEAIRHLARWLGKNPPTSKIESLVSELEEQGLWSLATHYREQAFRNGLDSRDGSENDENGEETPA